MATLSSTVLIVFYAYNLPKHSNEVVKKRRKKRSNIVNMHKRVVLIRTENQMTNDLTRSHWHKSQATFMAHNIKFMVSFDWCLYIFLFLHLFGNLNVIFIIDCQIFVTSQRIPNINGVNWIKFQLLKIDNNTYPIHIEDELTSINLCLFPFSTHSGSNETYDLSFIAFWYLFV